MQDLELKAKELKNAYAKKWRAQNKDKVRKSNQKYWQKRAKKELEG